MTYMLAVQLKVEDYAKWKESYDASAAQRKAAGELSYRLWRKADDPNELVMLCEWDTIDNAREFLASDDLAKAQDASGVTHRPECLVLEELDSGTPQ